LSCRRSPRAPLRQSRAGSARALPMRYSITMLAAKSALRRCRQLAQRDLAGLGRLGAQRGSSLAAHSLSSASSWRECPHSGPRRSAGRLRGHCPAIRASGGVAESAAQHLRSARARFGDPRLGFGQRFGSAGSAWQGPPTGIPPRRAARRSAPELADPPRQARKIPAAADVGNRPMPVSGMAKRVFSVATRNFAGWLMPTPPPMVIPSMKATTGLG
jgi:hypothetical protein